MEYKDSGVEWIGEIPRHWEVCSMKRCVRLGDEKSGKNGMPYVALENIEGWTGKLLPLGDNEPESVCNVFRKGDVLFSKLRPYLAKCFVAEYDGICSSELLVFKDFKGDRRYLNYLLLSQGLVMHINSSTYGSKMPRANWDFIGSCRIPLPPLAEQRGIAGWLDERTGWIDGLIVRKEGEMERLGELKQVVIAEAVTGRGSVAFPFGRRTSVGKGRNTKPSNIAWIGDIPEEWSKNKVARLFKIIGSGTTPRGDENFGTKEANDIPWINSGDLNDGIVTETKKFITEKALADCSALKLYEENCLIIAMYGATIGKLGISKIKACTNQACCVLQGISDELLLKYAFYAFLTCKPYLIDSAKGGTQPNISAEIIKQTWLPLPPLSEQRSIVEYIERKVGEIDGLAEALRREIRELRELRQRIVSDAVTGKVKV